MICDCWLMRLLCGRYIVRVLLCLLLLLDPLAWCCSGSTCGLFFGLTRLPWLLLLRFLICNWLAICADFFLLSLPLRLLRCSAICICSGSSCICGGAAVRGVRNLICSNCGSCRRCTYNTTTRNPGVGRQALRNADGIRKSIILRRDWRRGHWRRTPVGSDTADSHLVLEARRHGGG